MKSEVRVMSDEVGIAGFVSASRFIAINFYVSFEEVDMYPLCKDVD